jgi:hypothetical protein
MNASRDDIRERWAEGRSSAWNPPEKYWLGGVLTPWWRICPRCEVQGLWAPQSVERGYCERCRIDGVTA